MSQTEQDSQAFHSGMAFDEFQLPSDLVTDLFEAHFDEASLLQKQSIPAIITPPYKSLIVQGRRGTGKTLSFVTGMLARIDRNNPFLQSIYILPTRELVIQKYIDYIEKLTNHYKVNTTLLINDPLYQSDITKAQLIISTPMQLNQLINNADINLSTIKILVIDEANVVLRFLNFSRDKILFKLFFNTLIKNNIQILLFSPIITENVNSFISRYIQSENLNCIKVE